MASCTSLLWGNEIIVYHLAIFLSFSLALHDYIINSITIREYNFSMETILAKDFAQALVHTVQNTLALGTCT